jgi:heme/copper-type cytochrome/quinol oxidase subunit 2
MSALTRAAEACFGAALLAIVSMAPHLVAADRPVHEVQVVASRYRFEPAVVQVAAGEAVRLVVRSKDGIHGFAIPKLKIELHVPDNGDAVTTEFTAPAATNR